jgi:hypothetical protein
MTEEKHNMARTTSFFHRGQLRGSSGSEVGCIYLVDKEAGTERYGGSEHDVDILLLHVTAPEDLSAWDAEGWVRVRMTWRIHNPKSHHSNTWRERAGVWKQRNMPSTELLRTVRVE